MSTNPPDVTSIVEVEKEHVFQSYGRLPIVIVRGEGCHVVDADGKSYLDFVSGIGVNALGHAHPRMLKAICDQVGTLMHCSNLYYHPYQAPLAAHLARISGLGRTFFCNSGAEAVEGALKIAKGFGHAQDPQKFEIVALDNSFAGRTLGAVSVTGQPKYREPFEPLIPGVRFAEPNDVASLEAVVSERTAGIILEPILGEGGIVEIERDFARRAAELAKQHKALLIFDEIQSGLGRTGEYFAFQRWNAEGEGAGGIQPDVLLVAKPLGGGLPIGAVVATDRAAAVLSAGMHGSTFGGNALACRIALEFLDVLEEILPAMKQTGDYFGQRLGELVSKYDFVEGVRGRGLMRGLNLHVAGAWAVPALMEKGFLINCTAGTVLRFLPPYVIERAHIDQLIAALDELFEAGPPKEG
jgi:predicted acetylornithine/succinylornithine family transaminase